MSGSGDEPENPGPGGLPFDVDPALLQKLMSDLPPEIVGMMGPVQAALQSDDPKAALENLKDAGVLPDASDMNALRSNLSEMMEGFGAEVGGLQSALEQLGPMLAQAGDLQAQLNRFQEQFKFSEKDGELIQTVLKQANAINPSPHLAALLANTQEFTEQLRELLEGLKEDPVSQAQAFGSLQSTLSALQSSVSVAAAPSSQLKALLPLVKDYAQIASNRDHPLAAVLLARCAALEETISVAHDKVDPSKLHEQWEQALAAAESSGNLPIARLSAAAIQLRAAQAQNFALVAELASRVASLAESLGDTRTAVLCRTEEAQAYAQSGIPEAGRAIANQAIELAIELEDPKLIARAKITLGQVMHWAKELEQARDYFDTLIPELEADESLEHYLGRALLTLAKCHQDNVPISLLERAQKIGLKQSDAIVYVPTSLGLASRLSEAGETNEALSVLVQARAHAVAMTGAQVGKAFDELAGQFEEEWGKETFKAALVAFKEAHLSPTTDS
jgi:hypothetical protein